MISSGVGPWKQGRLDVENKGGSMLKITKTAFKIEARKGISYFGSTLTDSKGLPSVLEHIRQNGGTCPSNGTRKLLNSNNRNLKFETESGEITHFDVSGAGSSVHRLTVDDRILFIFLDKMDGQCLITVYGREVA